MRAIALLASLLSLAACGGQPSAPAEPPAPAQPAAPAEPAEPAAEAAPAPAAPAEPPDPKEACGKIIAVSYAGAAHAPEGVTRDKAAARAHAAELLAKVQGGADFAALAKAESDAPSSGPRGGVMGTYEREQWPEIHAPLAEPLFALRVGEVAADVVEASYGFVVLGRCPVEKARSRHILVRFAGAKNADADVKRDEAAAEQLAGELHAKATAPGADFAALAKAHSEDSSAERGGDVGSVGRGRLAMAYEDALFALQPGEIAPVVKSEFGFHVIQRLAEE